MTLLANFFQNAGRQHSSEDPSEYYAVSQDFNCHHNKVYLFKMSVCRGRATDHFSTDGFHLCLRSNLKSNYSAKNSDVAFGLRIPQLTSELGNSLADLFQTFPLYCLQERLVPQPGCLVAKMNSVPQAG